MTRTDPSPFPAQLVLCPHYPPRRFGGIEKVVQQIARAHARDGDRVLVATLDLHLDPPAKGSELWILDTDDGVPVLRIPCRAPSAGRRTETMLDRQDDLVRAVEGHGLARHSNRGAPWVLQVHDWFAAPAALALKRRYGLPILALFHSDKRAETEGELAPRKQRIVELQRQLAHRADAHFCLSAAMADSLARSLDLPRDRFEVLPCGIDEGVETHLDRPRTPEPRILYLGRLQTEKEVDVLVRAFARVAERLGPVRLQIVGRGRQREALEALGESLGVASRIDFEPFTSDSTIVDRALREAAVLVLPSRLEGFGLVVLEAMVRGTPVITSRCGGPTEIVRCGETGRCFDVGDVAALAKHLADTFEDWERTQSMAREGWHDVRRRFRWSQTSHRLRRAARRLLAAPDR